MCGVTAVLLSPLDPSALRQLCLSRSKLIRHRGPDWNGIDVISYGGERIHALAHERLSIVDPTSGKQPLNDPEGRVVCIANGEIYNHLQLRERLPAEEAAKLQTQSDCQVIPSLFKYFGRGFVSQLEGDFATIVVDRKTGDFLVARDPIGISPLYVGHSANGSIWFSSEVKALQQDCVRVREFPPGHSFFFKASKASGIMERFYKPQWMQPEAPIPTATCDLARLREELERAVSKRMMCDVPFGVLLYGGIDSAIIAAIVCRLYNERFKREQNQHFWTPKIHSFAIGVKGSRDLECSRMVAEHVGCTHHEFTFEPQEAIDALSDVIYMIESYDVLTVRAALLNYFLYRLIKSIGVKMVITGEGATDLFGCAGDMQEEPDDTALHKAIVKRLSDMHFTDSLRANKASMSWGVEARVPYLDVNFVEYAMSIGPAEKRCTSPTSNASSSSSGSNSSLLPGPSQAAGGPSNSTNNNNNNNNSSSNSSSSSSSKEGRVRLPKQLLRDAYRDELPQFIVDRICVDNQFGVSGQWTTALQRHANEKVSDLMLDNADLVFPYNPPTSKEAYLYRSLFSKHFTDQSVAKIVPGAQAENACSPAIKVLNTIINPTEICDC
ncbi:asparagine synthase, putative [Eimeria brunetti]|uniref:asparagine synthase (glutamine-hydrolyzing) n=1 Tax=Eimeria brunetti TaxID=51314 RepID=U6LGZ7_9EIME|nr:asparagine synthase, putative [Eimeria brunetti]